MIEIKVIHEIHDVRQQQQADLLQQLLPFMEKIVSQLSDLQDLGTGIKADLELIKGRLADQATSIGDLQAQLETLQQTTPPQVDLAPAIEAARAIKDEADAIVASFAPQEPPVGGDPTASTGDDSSPPAGSDSSDGSSTGADATGTSGGEATSPGSDTAVSGSTSSGDATGDGSSADVSTGADASAGSGSDVAQPGPDQGGTDEAQPGPDQGGTDAGVGDQSGLDQTA